LLNPGSESNVRAAARLKSGFRSNMRRLIERGIVRLRRLSICGVAAPMVLSAKAVFHLRISEWIPPDLKATIRSAL
jgi:hypothetical protein